MEAIRKKKVKRTGKKLIIDLPDTFIAEEVDLILWPSIDESVPQQDTELSKWRQSLKSFYSKYNVDLSTSKSNREDLYDRF